MIVPSKKMCLFIQIQDEGMIDGVSVTNKMILQGVSPLSLQSKSLTTQICVITHENQIVFHYFGNINFHLISNNNNINHILCSK